MDEQISEKLATNAYDAGLRDATDVTPEFQRSWRSEFGGEHMLAALGKQQKQQLLRHYIRGWEAGGQQAPAGVFSMP